MTRDDEFIFDLTKSILDEMGYKSIRNEEKRNYSVFFGEDEDWGSGAIMTLGIKDGMLIILAVSDKYVDESAWSRALLMCNKTNSEHWFGACYLRFDNQNERADLAFDGTIMLPEDVRFLDKHSIRRWLNTILGLAFAKLNHFLSFMNENNIKQIK